MACTQNCNQGRACTCGALQPRDGRDGVGGVAQLEKPAPQGADLAAGDGVDLAQPRVIEADAIAKTKREQTAANLARLLVALRDYDAIQRTGVVKDADGSPAMGVRVAGCVIHGGEYFWIDPEGCFTLDQLSEHGRLHPVEIDQFKRSFPADQMKYWFKWTQRSFYREPGRVVVKGDQPGEALVIDPSADEPGSVRITTFDVFSRVASVVLTPAQCGAAIFGIESAVSDAEVRRLHALRVRSHGEPESIEQGEPS